MTSTYPGMIDGYSQLRIVRNRIDEIVAEDVNNLRSAVISIEQTLGINPQGPFGTVVARLNDAYSNIEAHVLGLPPRHKDTVIESPARSGTYHSLSLGTVGSQLQQLLNDINTLNYPGSGSKTFADGYALPASYLRGAVSEIVGQIGRLTGSAKIGAAAFSDNKYNIPGATVNAQIHNLADFIDEGARFRERAFDSFVVEGMDVTAATGVNAAVASGYIASNGRLLRYGNGVITVPTGAGTYYIYAKIVTGAVQVSCTVTSGTYPFDPNNPIVLLHKIVHNGATWTSDMDIRRFGCFMNDKNSVTVGQKPTFGADGYGFDFRTLAAAVEYVKMVQASNTLVVPFKIVLTTDINISSTITLDVPGLEIDGTGRTIWLIGDIPVFNIEADMIKLHDIVVDVSAPNVTSTACLALIGNTTSVSSIRITSCQLKTSFSAPAHFFIRCGEVTGANTVTDLLIVNNIAQIRKGVIDLLGTFPVATINYSIIESNYFYQAPSFSATGTSAMRLGSFNVVDGNIIAGGFSAGLTLEAAESCIVSNNIFIGGTGTFGVPGTPIMVNGIEFRVITAGVNNKSIINSNIIKGITGYGIDCRASGSVAHVAIFDNIIDNSYDNSATMIGIRGRGVDTLIFNNKILSPGAYGIYLASNTIGNTIINGLSSLVAGILCGAGGAGYIINNNVVSNCPGVGIDVDHAVRASVSNNVLIGNGTTSTAAIDNIGDDCVLIGNLISQYTSVAVRTYLNSGVGASRTVFSNNKIMECPCVAVYYQGTNSNQIASGNIIINNGYNGIGAFYNFGGQSIITNNYIAGYGASTYWVIDPNGSDNSYSLISNNIINGFATGSSGGIINGGSFCIGVEISNNIIAGTPNTGISMNSSTYSICSGNFMSGGGGSGIDFIGSYSVVSGNVIRAFCYTVASSAAIRVNPSGHDCVITDNIVDSCYQTGIDLGYSGGNGGSNMIVSNNVLSGNYVGGTYTAGSAIVEVGDGSIISNNFITQYGYTASSYGISILGHNGAIAIIGNVMSYLASNTTAAIDVGCDHCLIANNTLGSYCLSSCGLPNIGIDLHGNDYEDLMGNYIYGNGTGTSGANSINNVGSYSLISSNYIYNSNYKGIYLGSGTINTISNNFIFDTKDDGIYGNTAYYVNIFGNNLTGITGNGIYCASAGYNWNVRDNFLTEITGHGIYLYNCGFSQICGNHLYDVGVTNSNYGIYINTNYSSISFFVVSSNYLEHLYQGVEFYKVKYATVVGNFLNYMLSRGFDIGGTDHLVFVGNVVYNHAYIAFDLNSCYDFVAVGNANFYPNGSGVTGMNINSAKYGTITGNRCEGSGTGKGFLLTSDTVHYNYNTMTGNISRNGANPRSWGTDGDEDVDNIWINGTP